MKNMTRKPKSIVGFFTMVGALLLSPMMLLAQEDDAPPVATAVAASPKLAIELGAPFRDNAVLQREMKLPVWGWSKSATLSTQ